MPDVIWPEHKALRRHMQGCAQYKLPGKAKVNTEQYSERQVRSTRLLTMKQQQHSAVLALQHRYMQAM